LPRPQKGAKTPERAGLEVLLAPATQGHDMGLVSEAGLPAVADPGAALVHAAHALGIEVVPLSGPSALLLALAASGLNGQSFAFVGYLPVDAAERLARIRELEALSRRHHQTQLMIETPYRNEALLGALLAGLGAGTRLSVSCGLTLPGGWTRSDTVAGWKVRPAQIAKDVPAVFSLLAS
jgi:16S rRNA (cytidine1402-2'-O)-methyltransferase